MSLNPRLIFLAAALFSAAACTEATDPATTDDTGASDTERDTGRDASGTDADDNGGSDEGGTDNGTDAGTDAVQPDGADDVTPDEGNDGGTTDTGTGTDATDTGDSLCGTDPFFSGQVFGTDAPNGGAPIFVDAFSEFEYADAGLSAVAAAFPDEDPEEPIVLGTPLVVTGATVVATSFSTDAAVPPSQSNFWVADSSGMYEVRLDFEDAANVPEFQVRVGHRMDFEVTAVSSYFGTGQIAAATNWTLDSTDNAVYILERTGVPITTDDIGKMVRVEGTLTANNGPCGGRSSCWDLDHGGDGPALYRTSSTFAEVGQCLTFVGPMSNFSGDPQINVVNFDWVWTYEE